MQVISMSVLLGSLYAAREFCEVW